MWALSQVLSSEGCSARGWRESRGAKGGPSLGGLPKGSVPLLCLPFLSSAALLLLGDDPLLQS